MGDGVAQPLRIGLLERQGSDPFAPEPDVDACGFGECGRQGVVEVAGAQSQSTQSFIRALDLRAQDACRRRRCRSRLRARLTNQDTQATQCEGTGAGGADDAAARD